VLPSPVYIAGPTTERRCAPVAQDTRVLSAVNFVSFSAGAHRLKGKALYSAALIQKAPTVAAALILFVPI